jgi:replicative DNA helicase
MIDIEREYLSAVMVDTEYLHAYPVPPQDFAKRQHQVIVGAMHAVLLRGEHLHMLSLRTELERTGQLRAAGGDEALFPLGDRFPANPAAIAKRIRELARLRELGEIANRVKLAESEGDLDAARAAMAEAVTQSADDDDASMSFREMCAEGVKASVGARQDDTANALKFGLPALDVGYVSSPGHLIVVGARPNVGKTSMTWGWHIDMARRGVPTGVISVDDDAAEYGVRGLGAISEINPSRLWNERLTAHDFDRVMRGIDRWRDLPIRFKHVRDKKLDRVLGAMHHMVRVHQVQMISIDFLTAIRGRGGSDERERHNNTLLEISALASVLKVRVVLVVQIKRGPDEYREPHLGDFAETGNIEQNAQAAVLLWRESDQPNAKTFGKVAKVKRVERGGRFVLARDPDTGLLVQSEELYEEPQKRRGFTL